MTVEQRTAWTCSKAPDARILGGPNIPKPLHGCAPRVYMGQTEWDKLRKRVYYQAGYKCEVCGADCSKPNTLDAHELYDIDYKAGTATFTHVFALCKDCHSFFHSGRMLTLYKQGSFLYPRAKLLRILEHGFSLIADWNRTHPEEPKLKAYATLLDYTKQDKISSQVETLIEKYAIEFWKEDKKNRAKWADWRLVYKNEEFRTPYADPKEWEAAMQKRNQYDAGRADNPLATEVFAEAARLVEEYEEQEGEILD